MKKKTFIANGSNALAVEPDLISVALPFETTVLPDAGLVPLQSILCTEELNNRPLRQPDYETENSALKSLVQALATSPRTILQTLADTILKVFKADSAGLSLLTKDKKRFYWPAIAGGWQPHIGGGTPREFGPCGDVLDCNAPLLFKHWELRYPYLVAATPPAEEGLLVPFYVEGKAVGTIWAIAHTEHRKFDSEDLRQLESLTQFASSAYQAVEFQKALEQSNTELIQGAVQLDEAETSRELADTLIRHLHDEIKERKQAEQQVRASEARFRALFDLGPVGIYSVDARGLIQEFNAVAAKLWGREPKRGDPKDRYCGSYEAFLLDGTPIPHEHTPMMGVLSGEIPEVRDAEVVLGRPDGSRVTVIVNIVPLKNAEGQIMGVMNCFYDITERKQGENALRLSEEFNRTIVESSPDCIKVLDLEGNLLSMQSGLELLGIEDITPYLNKSWIAWWDGDDRLAAKEAIDAGAAGGTGNFVGRYRKLNSELKWWDVVVSPILDAKGQPERLLVVSRDVTQREQAEEALRESREEIRNHAKKLETQVADRTAKLNDSIKSLESLNYTIAHDLRAPIRAMKSFTTALLEDVPLNETGTVYADRIHKAAGRMDQLVSDLLEYGEISHLEFPVHALDLKTEIAKVLAENVTDIQCAHAQIQVQELLPMVSGNETLLQQILTNLTLNALKFVAPGVKPHVKIWAEKVGRVTPCAPGAVDILKDGAHGVTRSTIRLWIEDNGIGIAPHHQKQIFDVFQRLHTTQEFPGTGVGLAIIKRAAERMGGTVGVESELGKGSRFWIELPGIN